MELLKTKGLKDEDFIQYHKPSMFIVFPYCTGKCNEDCGRTVCHNYHLNEEDIIEIEIPRLVERYLNNPITSAIVCGGMEPFDSGVQLYDVITAFRQYTDDDIVIYTGYNKDEVKDEIEVLKKFPNIIIKFGRFIPDQEPHFDDVLRVSLASPNQYGEKIS